MAEDCFYATAGNQGSDPGAYADWSVQKEDHVSLEIGNESEALCLYLSWDDFAALHTQMGHTLAEHHR